MISAYKKYFNLKEEIKALTDELEATKEELVLELTNEPQNKKSTPYAMFSLMSRDTYEYSDSVKQIEKDLRAVKKQEEKDGVAKVVKTSVYPTMRAGQQVDSNVIESSSKSIDDL